MGCHEDAWDSTVCTVCVYVCTWYNSFFANKTNVHDMGVFFCKENCKNDFQGDLKITFVCSCPHSDYSKTA